MSKYIVEVGVISWRTAREFKTQAEADAYVVKVQDGRSSLKDVTHARVIERQDKLMRDWVKTDG